jgi:hypothetical protein
MAARGIQTHVQLFHKGAFRRPGMKDEDVSRRYTVSWRAPFTTRWSKTHTESLASSFKFAWRKHNKGCSVDNITRGEKVIISSELMAQLLDEMDNLLREHPKQSLAEVAGQVIRGIENSETTE